MESKFILVFLSLLLFVSPKNQYFLSDPAYSDDGAVFTGFLNFQGDFNHKDYHYDWTRESDLLVPIKKLQLKISLECNTYLHFYVTDASHARWENPFAITDEFKKKVSDCSKDASPRSLKDFGLYISEDTENPFYIKLTNPENEEVIFDTENTDFLYTDIFIGFGAHVTSNDIYGFGERAHALKLGDGKFTMWPNDTAGVHEDTGEGGYGAMGIHPLGFQKTSKGSFVSLLFNNINAQDVFIQTTENRRQRTKTTLLEHRTVGGVIDYYLSINSSPNDAILSLLEIIGHPMLPPMWSLGFHQCRFGYGKTADIRDVYNGYTGYQLPIDTFWGDIDILQNYRDFTLNQQSFRDLPNLISQMHGGGFKFVPIVDLGIPINNDDEFYRKGNELDAWIKSGYTNENLISSVWPGKTHFPDFLTDDGVNLWKYGLEKYHEIVEYDGIWLDMNEPAMTGIDDIREGEILPEGQKFDHSKNKYAGIPYIPGYRDEHFSLASKSLSENAYSKLITENEFLIGYNFKPLIPLLECKTTNEQLVKMDKRPFILSRSTSMSQGRYSFHWLGDNYSTYYHMRNGLNGIFQFQIFGIPMTGDDICGFLGNTWDELCARWMTLGAFFPFARNHNCAGNRVQEPYVFEPNSKTLPSSEIALKTRYTLLRYYYTKLFKISLGEKGAFFQPTFFEFYKDGNTYDHVDESAMLGDSLILFPVFADETDDIKVYLPNDDWNVYPSGEIYKNKNQEGGEGEMITLSGKYANINIFMRGGKIIPYQETFEDYVSNTIALGNNPTELIINPSSDTNKAEGDIIFDNDATDTLKSENYFYIKFTFDVDTLKFEVKNKMKEDYDGKNMILSKLTFFRMKYLEDKNYGKLNIKYRGDKSETVEIKKNGEDIIKADLSELGVRFDEIEEIKFVE